MHIYTSVNEGDVNLDSSRCNSENAVGKCCISKILEGSLNFLTLDISVNSEFNIFYRSETPKAAMTKT